MKLNERLLRWVIESDDEKEIHVFSGIHKAIVETVLSARAGESHGH